MCLIEKISSYKTCNVVGPGFNVNESTIYVIKKASLDRNTHKTWLHTNWLMKMLLSEVHRNLILYFL